MKLVLDGKEYQIIPVPPHLSPYMTLTSELMKKKFATFEEAEETSKQIERLLRKVMEETISPQPEKEHLLKLFYALVEETEKVFKTMEPFRKPEGSSSDKSDTTRSVTP